MWSRAVKLKNTKVWSMNHSFDLKLFNKSVDVDHKIVLNKVFASSLMNLPRFEA